MNLVPCRLYQNRLCTFGVTHMLPGLYEAKALQQLRYFGLNIVGLNFVVLHLCTSLLSNVL